MENNFEIFSVILYSLTPEYKVEDQLIELVRVLETQNKPAYRISAFVLSIFIDCNNAQRVQNYSMLSLVRQQ